MLEDNKELEANTSQHEVVSKSYLGILQAITNSGEQGSPEEKKAKDLMILNIIQAAELSETCLRIFGKKGFEVLVKPRGFIEPVPVSKFDSYSPRELYSIMWEYFKLAKLTPNFQVGEEGLFQRAIKQRYKKELMKKS